MSTFMLILTYKLGGFILSLVDEVLKRLFHGVFEFLVAWEAIADDLINLVLEICNT